MSAIQFWPVVVPQRPQLCAWAHDDSPSEPASPSPVASSASGPLCFASPASASAALARVFSRTQPAAALRAAADAFAARAVEYLAQQRAGGGAIHAGVLDGVARATSAWLDAAASWAATRWPYALIEPCGGASSDGTSSDTGGSGSGSSGDILPPELTASVTVDSGDARGGSLVSTSPPQLARSTSWSGPAGAGSSVWGNGGEWGGSGEAGRGLGSPSTIAVRHGGIAYASVLPMRSFAALVAPGVSALRDPHVMMASNPNRKSGDESVEQSSYLPSYPAPSVARAMLAERLRHLRAAFRDAPIDAAAELLAANEDHPPREAAEHVWRAPVVVETDMGAGQNPFFFQTALDTSGFSSDDGDGSQASISTRLSWDGIAGPLVIEKGAGESSAPPNWARLNSELVADGAETDAPPSWDACVIAPSGGLPGEAIDAIRCDLERRVFRNSEFCALSSTLSADDAGEDIYTASRLRSLLSDAATDSQSRARPLDAPAAVRHPLTRSIVAAELACAVSRQRAPSPADALAALVAAAGLTERALAMGARGALDGEAGGGAVGADDFLPSLMWLILHEQTAAEGLASTLSFLKRFRPNVYGKDAYVLTSINAALLGLLRMASLES